MGTVRTVVLLTAGAAIGGAALIAYKISQETGKPMQEALAEVPAEAKRLFADVSSRATEAFEKGRAIYQEKQSELADQLRDLTSSE
jgi:gas vesicle protein